jgi:hypothetical protein
MKNWFSRNLTNIISLAFVIPILLVAFVSISHVTSFYGLSNPFTWAIYLSVGIEIAALSALAAVSVNMGRFVYFPFIIVTFIQMLGNIFFSFTYIDETSQTFQDWISMVGGLFENMGIETTDVNSHKTVLAFVTGGLLPVISLTFAHMLVKFTEKNKEVEVETIPVREEIKIVFDETKKTEEPKKWEPSEEQLSQLEEILKNNYPVKSENEHKPYQPSEEDLRKIEKVLNGYGDIVNENIDNNDVIEEPVEEHIVEVKEDEIQPEEVEKKNDIQFETGENYKVLNYLKRDA